MECEICGRKEAICLVYLEGAKLNCCGGCARGGKVMYYFDSGEGGIEEMVQQRARTEESIVDGYGKRIKQARISLGLSLEDLGMKIAEKANYLDHVERESTLPSLTLARKLEKFLKITLVESESVAVGSGRGPKASKELTLLDIAEIEHKEQKKGKSK